MKGTDTVKEQARSVLHQDGIQPPIALVSLAWSYFAHLLRLEVISEISDDTS